MAAEISRSSAVVRIGKKPADIPYIVIATLIGLAAAIMLYPFLYIIAVSTSDFHELHRVTVFPVEFHMDAFKFIFQIKNVQTGYLNSAIYTTVGVAVNLSMTVACSYALSRRWLPGRMFFNILILVTMYFGGGLIPGYLLVTDTLKLGNTIWALVLPGAIGVWNMIIIRTYFLNSVPAELDESAKIDGAGELTTMFRIYLPLAVPVIITFGLFCFVGHWNSWFPASPYLDEQSKWPIQLVLRNSISTGGASITGGAGVTVPVPEGRLPRASITTLSSALTISVVLPIIMIYPSCQKFFIKGIMVGSLKG